jgi:MFS family permease
MAYFVRDEPDAEHAGPEGSGLRPNRSAQADSVASLRSVFRDPAFYLLAIGSMCSIAAVGGANQHLKLYLSLDLKYSQDVAATIASTVLFCSIFGRLLMGWLADRIAKKAVMILIYVLVAGSIPLLLAGGSMPALYAFSVVFGLGLGGEYMIIPLMAAELFGVRVLGRLLGVILTADGVAEATSPMFVGYLRDHSASYRSGFLLLIVIALAGTTAIAMLPRRRAEQVPTHV